MPHLPAFARGLSAGLRTIHRVAGIAVIYVIGDTQEQLFAVPGKSEFESIDGNGQRTLFQSHDFIFLSGEIIVAGRKVAPVKGHKILVKTPGEPTLTHEVLPVMDGQEIHYCDSYRTGTRVHTKQIKSL